MNGFGLIQILLLMPCWLTAQWRQPRLVHFGSEQGMGYFSMDICQDVQGYIYFATDQGMVRYDGSEFKLFAHNPNDSTSIGPGDVWNISLGRDSLLWMGTRQSGIISFDPRTLRFTKHINPFKNGNIDRVSSVLADSACIWSGGTDSKPVSYTHLDVYKRQIMNCWSVANSAKSMVRTFLTWLNGMATYGPDLDIRPMAL